MNVSECHYTPVHTPVSMSVCLPRLCGLPVSIVAKASLKVVLLFDPKKSSKNLQKFSNIKKNILKQFMKTPTQKSPLGPKVHFWAVFWPYFLN